MTASSGALCGLPCWSRTRGALQPPEKSPELQVEGIATFSAYHISTDEDGIRQVGRLASELGEIVVSRIEEQTQVVLEEARSLDVDGLYERERMRIQPESGPDAAGRRRSSTLDEAPAACRGALTRRKNI
jgi:hypothetical protein